MIWIIAPLALIVVGGVGFAAWLGIAIVAEAGEELDDSQDAREHEVAHFVE